MRTQGEMLLARMELLYENLVSLLRAQSVSDRQDTVIKLRNEDGSFQEVTVKSMQTILNELRRVDNNFQQLTADESYFVSKDGTVKRFKQVSALKAEYLNSFNVGTECVTDSNLSLMEDFIFPIVKIPIELDTTLKASNVVQCLVYDISYGFETIPDKIKLVELEHQLHSGKIIGSKYLRKCPISKKHIELFGKFSIENVKVLNTDYTEFELKLNTISYSNRTSVTNNINLKLNDELVNADGSTKYIVTDVVKQSNIIRIKIVTGSSQPTVGIDRLYFNDTITDSHDSGSIIHVPIKPNKKLVVFFSTENSEFVSFPSEGLKINTSDFTVVHNNTTLTIDEYFQNYVINFSEYLSGLLRETTIPFSMGIRPAKPVLDLHNFQVVQINKHLVDGKSRKEILDSNKSKQSIKNEIEYKEREIASIESELKSQLYNSVEEKNYRVQKIVDLRREINVLKSNELVLARSIDQNVSEAGLTHISPKYRIIGFWAVQPPIYSPNTAPQNIVKYELLYRYLSKGSDVSETTTYKMVDSGREVSVVFSNWNHYQTVALNKVERDGRLFWEPNKIDSVDQININQCSIPINEGESVEIKIRAISEAGYPISPLISEWSDIIRIDFPDHLKDSNLSSIIGKNERDLNLAEFNNILQTLGVTSHIAGMFTDGDRIFQHSAKDIASGQYTPEQRNIPLDTVLQTIIDEIKRLKNTSESQNIQVSFVDFDREEYQIQHNTTLQVFAGNYTDKINVVDPEQYGSIVTKRAYIKIKNLSNVAVDIFSIARNLEVFQTVGDRYNGVPLIIGDEITQKEGQIIYFRNKELFGIDQLAHIVKEHDPSLQKTTLPTVNVKPDASESEQIYLGFDGNEIVKFGLIDNNIPIDGIVLHKSVLDNTTEDFRNQLKNEFKRLQVFGPHLRAANYQTKMSSDVINLLKDNRTKLGFNHLVDPYAVGEHTLGAWLYPHISKSSSIQTYGSNGSVSSYSLGPNREMLIPVIFEYRMTDKLGNTYAQNKHDISFTKKIGIDLLINNREFSFDVSVTAKYKSRISSVNDRNLTAISGAHNKGEGKELLD